MKEVIKTVLKKRLIIAVGIFVTVGIYIYLLTLPSKIIGTIIDLLSNIAQNKELITEKIKLLLIITLLCLIVRIIWRYLVAYTTRFFEKTLKDKLFGHFLKIKLANIQNIKNGELMSYFVRDIAEIRGFLYRILAQATRIFFITIIATYTMKSINIKLTIATLFPIIITTIVTIILKKHIEKNFIKSQKYFTNLSEYVQESTDAIRTTKAYSGEENQFKKFVKRNKILKQSNIAVDTYSTLLSISVSVCFGLCYAITIIYGSKLVLNDIITIGEFVAFNGYIDLFHGPISWLPRIIYNFKRAQISYNRLNNVFALEEEHLKITAGHSANQIKGNICIKNLTFNYPGNLDCILDNISIEIKEGETLGIIGTIGSGKTTLMNLLLRLYPIPKGKIFINNQDINNIDLTSLRNSISYITQDNFLFSTTIKDNIRYSRPEATDSEVIEAAKAAHVHHYIKTLSKGYEAVINEESSNISAGQKQLLTIARVILADPKILILDEATSSIDTRTEQQIQAAMDNLMKGRTSFIIAHRLSTIKNADLILVMDHGDIVEQGSHEELLAKDGFYAKLYNSQFEDCNDDIE